MTFYEFSVHLTTDGRIVLSQYEHTNDESSFHIASEQAELLCAAIMKCAIAAKSDPKSNAF